MHSLVLQFPSINLPFISSPHLCFTYPPTSKLFSTSLSMHTPVSSKCSNALQDPTGGDNNFKDLLSGIVGKQVEELLNREENRGLLDGLGKASERVEMAKRKLAEIERQELEANLLRNYVTPLESRSSQIAECQQEILEARTMVEEAERSLSLSETGQGNVFLDNSTSEGIDRGKERWESVKAASVSAVVGTLAGLPISLTQVSSTSELILPLGITLTSCVLFGVTFRYAIRRDLDNIQLKTGTSAAFGFVKGLATLGGGPPLELNPESFLSHAFNGAVYVSQNLWIFIFAAVGIDFCFKVGLLSPFPMKESSSNVNKK